VTSSLASPYAQGILRQTDSLQAILDAAVPAAVSDLVRDGFSRFSGIVLTGMGSGPFASYPAWLRLTQAGVPAWVVETAELINGAPALLSPDRLLVVISQSGESAEVLALLDSLGSERPTLLAVVNNLQSPLALAADVVLPLHVGVTRQDTAGTGTYINTIVAASRLVDAALGTDTSGDFARATDEVARYLDGWDEQVELLRSLHVERGTTFVLARGASLASARTGALLVKEAAKVPAEAMPASEFRHGPLELVGADFTAVMLAGAASTIELNRRMAQDILDRDGQVAWVGPEDGPGVRVVGPVLHGSARPIAEILPLQVLSVAAALDGGHQPGVFRHASRVTRTL
jgi:glutamine---fructose-6-phosphate transaminase (isomerizing)